MLARSLQTHSSTVQKNNSDGGTYCNGTLSVLAHELTELLTSPYHQAALSSEWARICLAGCANSSLLLPFPRQRVTLSLADVVRLGILPLRRLTHLALQSAAFKSRTDRQLQSFVDSRLLFVAVIAQASGELLLWSWM